VKRAATIAFLVGLLPILVVHVAYVLNIYTGNELETRFVCWPYLDGCVSISRASRSGPGLYLFRAVMLPCTVLLLLFWKDVRSWLSSLDCCRPKMGRMIFYLGAVGAVSLVFYVTALGSEGEWYRWLRRYGVTVYFGGTVLAQLLLVWALWPQRHRLLSGRLARPVRVLTALVTMQWSMGVFSVIKRLVVTDPDLVDRIENIVEWFFALPMALAFVVVGWMFRRTGTKNANHAGG
jgi:hypothetical protein